MSEVTQKFAAPDGTLFDSKAAAQEHMRKPHIKAALMTLTQGNEELSEWLLEQRGKLSDAFGIGTVKRVTKSERNKLRKAIEAVSEAHEGENKFAFLIEHGDDIVSTFKWPGQKRLKPEEKEAAIKEALVDMVGDDNAEVAEWITANADAIEEAYEAGKPKREPSPKAMEGLAKYQAKRKAEKEAAEAAKAAAE